MPAELRAILDIIALLWSQGNWQPIRSLFDTEPLFCEETGVEDVDQLIHSGFICKAEFLSLLVVLLFQCLFLARGTEGIISLFFFFF